MPKEDKDKKDKKDKKEKAEKKDKGDKKDKKESKDKKEEQEASELLKAAVEEGLWEAKDKGDKLHYINKNDTRTEEKKKSPSELEAFLKDQAAAPAEAEVAAAAAPPPGSSFQDLRALQQKERPWMTRAYSESYRKGYAGRPQSGCGQLHQSTLGWWSINPVQEAPCHYPYSQDTPSKAGYHAGSEARKRWDDRHWEKERGVYSDVRKPISYPRISPEQAAVASYPAEHPTRVVPLR
eukprot:Hpha_TRINITY_DN15313_c3_g7::TRINITY_DN15313_c3_g7_i1::g.90203::m.90203